MAERFLATLRRIHQFTAQAEIGQELTELMERFDSLLVFRARGEDDETTSITAIREQPYARLVTTQKDLLTAIQTLLGKGKKKKCLGKCGKRMALAAFARSKSSNDGYGRYCLMCERNRVKESNERKRELAGRPRVKRAPVCKPAAAVNPGPTPARGAPPQPVS